MSEPERSRLRRDELKALVLEAGLELLQEEGLGAKTVPIGYADAFRWLRDNRSLAVSRAQVHRRIWNSLAEYRDDVMTNMVRVGWPGEVLDATANDVADAIGHLNVAEADATTRLDMLCNLARRLTDRNANALRTLGSIAPADAVFAMHSLGATDQPASPAVAAAIIENKTEILDRYIDLYTRVGDAFGAVPGIAWGLNAEDGMRMYAEILSCLNQGAAGRSSFEPALQEIPLGGDVWSVEGLSVYAVTGHVASINGPRTQKEEDCVVEPLLVTEGNNLEGPGQPERSDDVGNGAGSRMERETLRRHMIHAGMEVLLERGFGHGAEQITYSRVFERIKERHGITVARAQVHRRIWPSQNQFQLELLATAARQKIIDGLQPAAEQAAQALTGLELSSPTLARSAAANVVRAAAAATVEELTQSRAWLLGRAIMSFHALNRTRSETVGRALHQEYEDGITGWTELFAGFALAVGYQPRAWTRCSLTEVCEIAARCADVLVDGVIARSRMLGETPTYRLSIEDQEPQHWDILGIGTWCVVDFLMEPGTTPPSGTRDQNSM